MSQQESKSLLDQRGELPVYSCGTCQSNIVAYFSLGDECPYCLQSTLQPGNGVESIHSAFSPEAYLPIQVAQSARDQELKNFARSIPFRPVDLNTRRQLDRMTLIYLPIWWVDVAVKANWQAEVGYPYEVLSHQEKYEAGQWKTHEVREKRLTWEWRGGTLERQYDNIPAPAFSFFEKLQEATGFFDQRLAEPYAPESVARGAIILPDRSIREAWSEARYELDRRAQEECEQAAGGEAIREFAWEPEFGDPNWTQLLVPVWQSSYLDDEGNKLPIYFNTQTGQSHGIKRASPKRARRWSAIAWLSALIVVIGAGLAFLFVPINDYRIAIAIGGGISVLSAAIAAIAARARVNRFNWRQGMRI